MSTPTDAQIRQLAASLNKPQLSFDPGYMRKATVTAIDPGDSNTPPTVTLLLSGDTTTPISGVYIEANYSPQVGDTALLYKQGDEFFAKGAIASTATGTGWAQASLHSGHSHNGNSNGPLMYRRVLSASTCWIPLTHTYRHTKPPPRIRSRRRVLRLFCPTTATSSPTI